MQAFELLLDGLPSLLSLGVSHSALVQESFEIFSSVTNGTTQLNEFWSTTAYTPGL